MRPVRLAMDGFASYRRGTEIDFTDAGYFALVGPTGSGKSTVIDAITFALYGTVPRWNDQRKVAPALAPTANRGVVSLTFDADGHRYVAAREVRRSGGKTAQVSMHACRLERLADPDNPAGDTEVLAADSEVTAAVEQLLGLSYEHFTICVALPQNQFMQFLHAKASDRQDILSSLLGHQLYERLQKAANERARDAKTRREYLTEHLQGLTDATAGRVDELNAASANLTAVQEWFTDEGLVALQRAGTDAATEATAVDDAMAKQAALAAVAIPADVAALDAALTAAIATADSAAARVAAVEDEENTASAVVSAFRPRHELVQLQRNWAELADLEERMPRLSAQLTAADSAQQQAAAAVLTAEAAGRQLRAAADQHDAAAATADAAVTAAQTATMALAGITVPDAIAPLAAALTDLGRRRVANEAESAAAEKEHEKAVGAVDACLSEALLAAGASAASTLQEVLHADASRRSALDFLTARVADAAAELSAATSAAEAAADRLEHAQVADQAGMLRGHLVAGQSCPVCEQTVSTVPAAAAGSDVAAAQAAHAAARTRRREVEETHRDLQRMHDAALADREAALRHADAARIDLRAPLASLLNSASHLGITPSSSAADLLAEPIISTADPAALDRATEAAGTVLDLFSSAAEARTARAAAVTAAEEYRRRLAAARRDLDSDTQQLEQQRQGAAAALFQARDTVITLDAPAVDASDLALAWQTLADWAATQHATRTEQLPALRATAAEASKLAAASRHELAVAETQLARLRRDESETGRQLARLTEAQDAAAGQNKQLRAEVAGEPDRAEVASMLADLDRLEAAQDAARKAVAAARTALTEAVDARRVLDTQAAGSRQQLDRVRDPLTRYGAPEITATTLAAAWQQLAAWAQAQHAATGQELVMARAAAARAQRSYDTAAATVHERLTAAAVSLPEDTGSPIQFATACTGLLAAAVASARADARAAAAAWEQRARFEDERDVADERFQVASTLARLLKSDQFQAWLLEAAIEALVLDASAILLEMSSGQFELRFANKDLEVIDHNDADATRPVRTLSGGETFQASLALALALSRQVSSLAASGAATLESIFLDEGFGTLDDTSLDVVAGTLENLAASGERMVGVITHVQALADRIPVRFRVTRSGTTSSIERITI